MDQCFHFCLPCIVDGLRRKQIRANGASSGTAINRLLRYLRVSTRDAGRCAYACVGTLGIGATLPVNLVLIPQMPQWCGEAAKLREQWHLSDRTHGQRSRHHSQPAGVRKRTYVRWVLDLLSTSAAMIRKVPRRFGVVRN